MITRNSVSTLACIAAFLAMTLFPPATHAECVRWTPPKKAPNAAPEFDGPGAFGVLHNTVTLDCLSYAGSIEKNGVEHVLIRDETGTVHQLRLGSYMGENNGVIMKIDAAAIHIKQLVRRNGRAEEIDVKFAKRTK